MAITVTQQPNATTLAGQALIVTCQSDNVTEPNFRIKVDIAGVGVFYIPPNPENVHIFDCRNLQTVMCQEFPISTGVHSLTAQEPDALISIDYDINLYEAWDVGGVLTDDPDALGATNVTFTVFNGTFQAEDGYQPSISSFELDGVTKRFMSDREIGTHQWQFASTFNITGNCIYIPSYESDWGVFTIAQLGDAAKIRVTIFQSNGTPASADYVIGDTFGQYPLYPANLNVNLMGLPKPSDYPNWRYIQIRALDSSNNVVSANYILYNAELYGQTDCNWDKIRIAWVGSRGGWEYQNFIKKSEESIEIERKRYNRVLGDFGATYSQNGMQRGLTEGGIIAPRYLTATSDWISEEEFVFLRGLMVSKQVHWVQSDGTFIPILVEDTQYTEQKIRDGKNKNLTVKFRYANNLWT